MKKNHETPKTISTCRDCSNFCGLNPSFKEGAPPAWCHPFGNQTASPCTPWEDARRKVCFQPK